MGTTSGRDMRYPVSFHPRTETSLNIMFAFTPKTIPQHVARTVSSHTFPRTDILVHTWRRPLRAPDGRRGDGRAAPPDLAAARRAASPDLAASV